jgi:hypothetical protein
VGYQGRRPRRWHILGLPGMGLHSGPAPVSRIEGDLGELEVQGGEVRVLHGNPRSNAQNSRYFVGKRLGVSKSPNRVTPPHRAGNSLTGTDPRRFSDD